MSLEIRQEAVTSGALGKHASISIAFAVDRVLEVTLADGGMGGMSLTETRVADPYVKDYDAEEGEGPTHWAARFDISNWGLLSAWRDGALVGGAVIAFRTPDVYMLDGRNDVAVLWDIRVAPEQRGTGVGSALFHAVEGWAGPPGAGGGGGVIPGGGGGGGRRGRGLAQDRDAKRQHGGLPLLPEDGLHPGGYRPICLSWAAG